MNQDLPGRRRSSTVKLKINGQSIFLTCGEYDDGRLGEIWVDVNKAGTGLQAAMSCFAAAVSIGLQHGVPLGAFVRRFRGVHFEPSNNEYRSIIDAVFAHIQETYHADLRTDAGSVAQADDAEASLS